MGKHSNVILLNADDIIIDSARHIAADRNILPANPFTFLQDDKLDFPSISCNEFISLAHKNTKNFSTFLQNTFYGFSKCLITYIVNKLKINLISITDEDYICFYNYTLSLVNNINILHVSCIDFEFNNKNDYVLINDEKTSNLKINTFIDTYYTYKEKSEDFKSYRDNILKLLLNILGKYQKRLNNINSKLDECNNMDKYKLYGELITANLYKLDNNSNIEKLTLENYYNNNEPIEIKLNKKYSISVNAKRFYKKYNKLKNTLEIVSKQKENTKKELNYIESIIYSLNFATNLDEVDEVYLEIQENLLNKHVDEKKSKDSVNKSSPISLNIDGYNILVGRNNKQNDYLTFKLASKNDLWFHTENIHGSHVILKLDNNKQITDEIICKVASIAAYYSKGRNSSKVNVQYTEVKNIKKPKNAKPGFVVFNHYKTILVEPKEYKN